jgi:tetratricopeptide (TPR) repeat protein
MPSMNLKQNIASSILTDDLITAQSLLEKNPNELPLLADLLDQVHGKALPLSHLTAGDPDFIVFFPSYTCGVGCKMCCTGFSSKTQLYEKYLHMSPEQFDSCMPWVKNSKYVIFCGLGETLESPHMLNFLGKIQDKISIIYTSGVPLTRVKIRELIQAELKILTFSFDGKAPLGHGGGNPDYIRKFWEKIDWVQQLKTELNSKFPKVTLNITVSQDNQDELSELIDTAQQHGIQEIMIDPMTSFDQQNFKKTVFADFENSKNKINPVLDRWNSEGVDISQTGFTKSFSDSNTCPYVDNWLTLIGTGPSTITTGVCNGQLEIPTSLQRFHNKEVWDSFPIRYLRYLHFCSTEQNKPMQCQNCILTNLKNYADLSLTRNAKLGNDYETALDEYRQASKLKIEKKFDDARQGFFKALENHHDFPLKGKAYFHLGEMELNRKDYLEARKYFELAVQYFYEHDLAFAYLYFLIMMDPPSPIPTRREKFDASSPVDVLYDKYLAMNS